MEMRYVLTLTTIFAAFAIQATGTAAQETPLSKDQKSLRPPLTAVNEFDLSKSDSRVAMAFGNATPTGAEQCPVVASHEISALIKRIAMEEQFDPELADAIAWVESRHGAARSSSQKGALGIMQLMPATASDLGVTDRCDPESNIRGGVRYLKSLYEKYDDPFLAIAAFNAGPGTVEKKKGIPEYAETERYLVRVLNRWKLTKKFEPKGKDTDEKPTAKQLAAPEATGWVDNHVFRF